MKIITLFINNERIVMDNVSDSGAKEFYEFYTNPDQEVFEFKNSKENKKFVLCKSKLSAFEIKEVE